MRTGAVLRLLAAFHRAQPPAMPQHFDFALQNADELRVALAETDSSVLAAYTEATGTAIDSAALTLFRMWYDLSEIAEYICLFRDVHTETEDTAARLASSDAELARGESVSHDELAEVMRQRLTPTDTYARCRNNPREDKS